MGKKTSKVLRAILKILAVILIVFFIWIYLMNRKQNYTYVNNIWFPLWYVALLIAVPVGIGLSFVLQGRDYESKSFFPMLLTFIAVAFVGMGGVFASLNYASDTVEVERYFVEIEEKDFSLSRRSDYYWFFVTARGETFKLRVLKSDYNSHDVGDSYIIEYHEGALGVPYYIAVGPVP